MPIHTTTKCWGLWRRCCCRLGIYPLAVALVMTAACLLSVYSSTACEFVDLSVGFTPTNAAMNNQSQVLLGLFYYQPVVTLSPQRDETASTAAAAETDVAVTAPYLQLVREGCQPYTTDIESEYMNGDRTWRTARIMALIAAAAAALASLLAWSFCVTACLSSHAWGGILLPLTMIAFIAEGSKFLMFDISLCRNNLWLPTGVDSLPQSAQSCELGETAFFSIAAGALLLLSLSMVCLQSPEYRDLDPNFGVDFENQNGNQHDVESQDYRNVKAAEQQDETSTSFPAQESLMDDVYTTMTGGPEPSEQSGVWDDEEDSEVGPQLEEASLVLAPALFSKSDPGEKPAAAPPPHKQHVSESRLSKVAQIVAQMEQSSAAAGSEKVIADFVTDVNSSFQSPPPDE